MATPTLTLVASDPTTHAVAWNCQGPDERGACPRVAIGEMVPCIGLWLANPDALSNPYTVPKGMTLCPVTLTHALAVASDSSLLPA